MNGSTEDASQASTRRQPVLTFDRLWLIAAVSLVAFSALRIPVSPNDFWWHLAAGRIVATEGRVPTSDPFSFTRHGQPWFDAAWLGQLSFYGMYRLGGVELILLAQAILLVAAYSSLVWLCVRASDRPKLAAALLIITVIPFSMGNWHLRPQSLTVPLFAAFLLVIDAHKRDLRAPLYVLPVLMMAWVNIHGSFLLGLVLIGAAVAGEVLDRRFGAKLVGHATLPRVALGPLIGWGTVTAAATLVNPRGIGALGYVQALTQSDSVKRVVSEWQPLTVNELGGAAFFGLVGMYLLGLVYSRRRPLPSEALVFVGFLLLALSARRNVMWFMFVATPMVARYVAESRPRLLAERSKGIPLLNAVFVILLTGLVLSCLPWVKPIVWGSQKRLLAQDTPVQAAGYLQGLPQRPRRLFHENGYGSYLMWALPDQPVFIDPRFELYPLSQWEDYIRLSRGHEVESLLTKYDIDALLLSRAEQGPLIEAARLDRCHRWEERYSDEISVYFARRAGAPKCCPCPEAEHSAR